MTSRGAVWPSSACQEVAGSECISRDTRDQCTERSRQLDGGDLRRSDLDCYHRRHAQRVVHRAVIDHALERLALHLAQAGRLDIQHNLSHSVRVFGPLVVGRDFRPSVDSPCLRRNRSA